MHPVTLLPFEEIYLTNLLVLSGGKGILRRASEDNFTVCGFSISDYELSLIGEEIERATNRPSPCISTSSVDIDRQIYTREGKERKNNIVYIGRKK